MNSQSTTNAYTEEDWTIVLSYVDDILIASTNSAAIEETKSHIGKEVKVKDMGEVKRFIGMDIDIAGDYMKISQRDHIETLISRLGMNWAKSRKHPMESNAKYTQAPQEYTAPTDLFNRYRSAIRPLLYISQNSRPNAVNYLSRFQANPTEEHFTGVKRIIRYLIGTMDYGFLYNKSDEDPIVCYVDASWGENPDDRSSTSGYLFSVYGNIVLWRS